VSYGLAIAGDARVDMNTLEPWLQEEVLDELEMLVADPSPLSSMPPGDDFVYAFNRRAHGRVHYLFLSLSCGEQSAILTMLGLTHRELLI
jgi:hypothetical protein